MPRVIFTVERLKRALVILCFAVGGCGPSPFEELPDAVRVVEDRADEFVFDSDANLVHGVSIETVADLAGCWGRTFDDTGQFVDVYQFSMDTGLYARWSAQKGQFEDERLLLAFSESGSFELRTAGVIHVVLTTVQARNLATGFLEDLELGDASETELLVSLVGDELRISEAATSDVVDGLRPFECP